MWLFCTAKINRISVSDCGSRTKPSWEHVLPGHTELVPGVSRGLPWAPRVPTGQTGRVPALGSWEPALWHSVLPLPCRISPDSTDWVTAQQWGEQKCVEEGWEMSRGSAGAGRDAPRQDPPGWGPVSPVPCGWVCQKGPMFIYAHHFLPPGTLLLPNISALLPNFCHLFSRSWRGEWEFFPNWLLLKVTPEQGLMPTEGQVPWQFSGHPASLTPSFSQSCSCNSYTVSVCNNNKRKLNPTFYSAMFRL